MAKLAAIACALLHRAAVKQLHPAVAKLLLLPVAAVVARLAMAAAVQLLAVAVKSRLATHVALPAATAAADASVVVCWANCSNARIAAAIPWYAIRDVLLADVTADARLAAAEA